MRLSVHQRPISSIGQIVKETAISPPGQVIVIREIVVAMRPKQWIKNLVIFLALIFSFNQSWRITDPYLLFQMVAPTATAFVLFCLFSSSIYLVNDIRDVERDRQHPRKRHRPLASGRLKINQSIVAIAILLATSLPLSFALNLYFGIIGLIYVTMMIIYSFFLRDVAIVDVITIAVGFVLRAVSGAVVISVPISPWLYVCTILGALVLGLGKRRHELILLQEEVKDHRHNLDEYTPELLEQMITIVASATVMAYSLYTFSAEGLPKNYAMMATIPFVLYGVFRYLHLIHIKNEGGSPEELVVRDLPLVIDFLLWILASATILALFRP
ncbi:MAG: decaprenyl-phosphate phosphoribosyltransferase [Chloroflexi bacterium]|nr:decaprenyl-phosphate phosphoribosyltransferase [Chloroflexota bacterium]